MSKIMEEHEFYMLELDCEHSINAVLLSTNDGIGRSIGKEIDCPTCAEIAQARAEGRREALESCMEPIRSVIEGYNLTYTLEAGTIDGLSLVDALVPPGAPSIAEGKKEIELLIDFIQGAIQDLINQEKP